MKMKKYIAILLLAALSCSPESNNLDEKPEGLGDKDKKEQTERPEPGKDSLYGYVRDNSGKPVADAVVSDGFSCGKTDSEGYYCFTSACPQRSKFVHVSIPDGYRPKIVDGVPVFFSKVPAYSNGVPRKLNNIVLQKASPLNDYYVIMTGDPQSRAYSASPAEQLAFTSESAYRDHLADIAEKVKKLDRPCFGIAMGDIVFNDPSQYSVYTEGLSAINSPFFAAIGNHDHQYSGKKDDDECAVEFEEVFGPRNCSFNIGKLHYVLIDNMIFEPDPSTGKITDFSVGIEDAFMTWLEKDLSYVDKNSTVMICAHVPFCSPSAFSAEKSFRNMSGFKALIAQYKAVYLWSGHVHRMDTKATRTSGELPNVEEHTLLRSTGSLKTNDFICDDGTPRGYMVVSVSGSSVTWKYHPCVSQTGACQHPGYTYPYRDFDFVNGRAVMRDGSGELDERYQMKVYSRGDYDDDYIYVNVFMWDSKWSVPVLTVDGKDYPMEQKNFHDQCFTGTEIYYKDHISFYTSEPDYSHAKMHHHFSLKVPDGVSGTGTVSVKDRFGNTYSKPVNLDPIKYTDGKTHLVFDFTTCPPGWPTESKTNVTLPYTLNGTTYNFILSKGCYTSTYLTLSGNESTLTLPAIPGKKLTGVTVRISKNTKERPMKIINSAGGIVTGGRALSMFGEESFHWDLKGTKEGTSYSLYSGNGLPIGGLRLTYE